MQIAFSQFIIIINAGKVTQKKRVTRVREKKLDHSSVGSLGSEQAKDNFLTHKSSPVKTICRNMIMMICAV